MIKRVIFDLDNTLIMWREHYWDSITKTFDDLKIEYDENTLLNSRKAVDMYECKYDTYDHNQVNKIFEEYTGLKIPNNFSATWLENLKNCFPNYIDTDLIETLDYLYNKYELVVLTNWFTESQKCRLDNCGILKYFKEVYGGENVKIKPNLDAFLLACGDLKPEECIMIGDNLEIDILGAKNAGIKALLFDYENKYNYDNKVVKIKELMSIL